MEELLGTVQKIRFRNDENGYTVFLLEDGNQVTTVTGNFTALCEGEYIRVMGQFRTHKSYGRQFQSLRKVPHTTKEGICKYLSSRMIKGIGAKTARKIVSEFGTETLHILDNHPERLVEVESIGKKKLEAIQSSWEEHRTNRTVELFLLNNALSPALASKILHHYAEETIEVLTRNPYRLAMDIKGIGFISADSFAMKLGVPATSKERLKAAVLHIIRSSEDDGHTFLTDLELYPKLEELTGLAKERLTPVIPESILELQYENYLIAVNYADAHYEGSAYYQTALYNAEQDVAEKVSQLANTKMCVDEKKVVAWLDHYISHEKMTLSSDQCEAVLEAVQSRIYILTGGPGVGKSTTANAIIKLLQALGKEVALAAPTGRAAQRLGEITGKDAKTIHRLLEWSPKDGFQKNQDQCIEADAIIVDESSMLDIRLARALMNAIALKSQVIFLGDVDQLPSVGPGHFLNDLISSQRIPYAKLTQIFRQAAASDIVKNAHDINQGRMPAFDNSRASDCKFIAIESASDSLHAICRMVTEILPNKTELDPIQDIQILTPMKKTDLGSEKINKDIQQLLNPPSMEKRQIEREKTVLRQGDKVIQTVNNYELNVFNGDIGHITDIAVQGGKTLVQFGSRSVEYDNTQVHELKLAYAITIHKSQGSEFPAVVIPVSMSHYMMLQRNLFYTALTRAKKLAIFIGSQKALAKAIQNNQSTLRRSRLNHLIRSKVHAEKS